jgi:hypothetical protein
VRNAELPFELRDETRPSFAANLRLRLGDVQAKDGIVGAGSTGSFTIHNCQQLSVQDCHIMPTAR